MTKTSKIVLGLWPIAGVTTLGVTRSDADKTIQAAIEAGITQFDTAYSYGYEGESDRILSGFLQNPSDEFFVMGKVGQRWTADRQRAVDGSPAQLTKDAEEHLARLKVDQVNVLYLHSPDPNVELERSAEAMLALKERGLCQSLGICNASLEQVRLFNQIAGCDAIQCPLNLIQRQTQSELIAPATQMGADVYVFWTLMKGLLAGKIGRDHQFAEGDSRPKYPIFQGEQRRKAHDIIDHLADIGSQTGLSVAQLSIGWAVSQPGITGALVGARRPEQIDETLRSTTLSDDILQSIDAEVQKHFPIAQ
ncbi:aldo/keto reductase [Stieleria sp. JC731]|uniref:aldo/keto reductase n=1 Tax=Pirellulaceae TaxID=2691357 RepID=UPI001E3D95BF|nr:aldo/keto reductase [Stieleria sp. JC731]MCC9602840.1 aldo/keto reductase [Stieleria sp. JC731]